MGGNASRLEEIHKMRRPLNVYHASVRGRRPTQEDRHIAMESVEGKEAVALFGVFDGHNGDECAEFVKQHLHKEIVSRMDKNGHLGAMDITSAFTSTDDDFLLNAESVSPTDSGCTAVVAVYNRVSGRLITGNCGDARCVLSREGKAVALTIDHKPSVPDERKRIENAGRQVKDNRLDGVLAVSRALGDRSLKHVISHNKKLVSTLVLDDTGNPAPVQPSTESQKTANEPQSSPHVNMALTPIPFVSELDLKAEDEFLVIACDGLFDVMSNQEVVDWVRENLRRFEKMKPQHPDAVDDAVRPHANSAPASTSTAAIPTDATAADTKADQDDDDSDDSDDSDSEADPEHANQSSADTNTNGNAPGSSDSKQPEVATDSKEEEEEQQEEEEDWDNMTRDRGRTECVGSAKTDKKNKNKKNHGSYGASTQPADANAAGGADGAAPEQQYTIAHELANYAIAKGSMDNISIIIVTLGDIPACNKIVAKRRKKSLKAKTLNDAAQRKKSKSKSKHKGNYHLSIDGQQAATLAANTQQSGGTSDDPAPAPAAS